MKSRKGRSPSGICLLHDVWDSVLVKRDFCTGKPPGFAMIVAALIEQAVRAIILKNVGMS